MPSKAYALEGIRPLKHMPSQAYLVCPLRHMPRKAHALEGICPQRHMPSQAHAHRPSKASFGENKFRKSSQGVCSL